MSVEDPNGMMGAGLEQSFEGDDGLEDLYKGEPVNSFGGDLEGSMEFKHELPGDTLDPHSPMGAMSLPPVNDGELPQTATPSGNNDEAPPDMKDVLGRVEDFLLPGKDRSAPWYRGVSMSSNSNPEKASLSPESRFREVLLQVAIADHIRIFQTMYRDNNDEQSLFSELRTGDDDDDDDADGMPESLTNTIKPALRLDIKALQSKIVEGRVRANALCRLCYGEDSLEMLKGTIDLASAYALQGMWPQVSEHMAIAAQKLITVVEKRKKAQQLNVILRARDAAARVECVYRVLREHAVANRGHIKKEVLETLVLALGDLPRHYDKTGLGGNDAGTKDIADDDDPLRYPTQLVALLHGFMTRHAQRKVEESLAAAQGNNASMAMAGTDKLISRAFADMNLESGEQQHHQQQQQQKKQAAGMRTASQTSTTIPLPSWGEVVTYLREECLLMRSWLDDIEAGLLPQVRAALFLPFKQSDGNHRGAVHPVHLHYHLQKSPAAMKALSGTGLMKRLQQLKIEMPLQINPQLGSVKVVGMHIMAYTGGSGRDGGAGPGEGVATSTEQEWDRVSAPNSPASRSSSVRSILASKGLSPAHDNRTLGRRVMLDPGIGATQLDMSSAEYVLEDFTTPTQSVLYELPVLWEEVQAMVMGECIDDQADILRAQVVTLLGVVHMFGDKVDSAEESMGEALRIMSRIGLEQEVASCELYNSIAQMMIIKYRSWNSQKKGRARKATAQFMGSEKGRTAVKKEVEHCRVLYLEKQAKEDSNADAVFDAKGQVLSREVRDALAVRAKENVGRRFLNDFYASEADPTKKAVEAATRYLVRSFEIISEVHGQNHPSSGTACLAVASVHSVSGLWEQSREWLVRALRCFERTEPRPSRAIAFTQHQLSTTLLKLDHADECMRILDKAATFHLEKARGGLTAHAKEQRESGYTVFTPVQKGSPLYEDVLLAMNMTSKIVRMISKKGGKWQAAEQAEIVAELADSAFGWDSATAGEAFKEVANRYAAISDWQRSANAFKKAQHAFEAVYGKEDRKAITCAKSFLKAEDKKKASIKQADDMMRANLGPGDGVAGEDGEDGSLHEEVAEEGSELTASPATSPPNV